MPPNLSTQMRQSLHSLRLPFVPNYLTTDNGYLDIDLGGGKATRAALKNGVPYFRNAGVEHDVINGNDFECAFVEIELLDQP